MIHPATMAESLLFARYRLLEPTGMGGTAAVWRAVDESTDEEVAVKRLHPALLADEATRVRLVREFGALRKLDHPRVVRVRDLELGRTDAALVLDYVPGPSLAVRLLDGPVPPADALRLVSDVASALDAAHAAGILHRDVKPGNILLRDDGAALLTDFGIVGSLDEAGDITAVGTVVGTFRYMSPQRLAGAAATRSDDVYALGVVAWQALAGRPPFDAPTPLGVADRIAAGPPALEGVPRAVDDPPGDRGGPGREVSRRLVVRAGSHRGVRRGRMGRGASDRARDRRHGLSGRRSVRGRRGSDRRSCGGGARSAFALVPRSGRGSGAHPRRERSVEGRCPGGRRRAPHRARRSRRPRVVLDGGRRSVQPASTRHSSAERGPDAPR
jgi:hypothetical protein